METLLMRHKLWVLVLLLLAGWNTNAFGQPPCSGGTHAGTVTPTIPWQTFPCLRGGQYLEYRADSGARYTFTVCTGGGAASWDTQLTMLDSLGNFAFGYADDECFLGSYLYNWQAPYTGKFRILLNRWLCLSGPDCAILAYKREPNPAVMPGAACGNAYPIPSLPFSQSGLSTCGFGNDYNSSMACGSSYLNSSDFVFSYNGTAGECLTIFTRYTFTYTGLFIYDGCPSDPTTNCISYHESGNGSPFLSNVSLPTTTTYYIVVSGASNVPCTPFDIDITNCVAVGVGNTCSNAFNIPSLPYQQSGFTTCGFGDDYSNASACGSNYMGGDDFVFRYSSPGSECIKVQLTNTDLYTAFFVTYGCPDDPAAVCVAAREEVGGNPVLRRIDLTAAGDYYITVSTWPNPQCTPFNILVEPCSPLCNSNPNGNNSCFTPTGVTLGPNDTICGFTDLNHTSDANADLTNDFCGSIENNSWFNFEADSSTMTFGIDVDNCLSGYGIQAMVFQNINCNIFNPVSNCWNPMVETSGTFQANGLVVGNTYTLMLDGYAGDDCEYSIYRITGPLPVEFGPFTATAKGIQVNLAWETYMEVNNRGFTIERGQLDDKGEQGHIDWTDVATVPGQGDAQAGAQYSQLDEVVFNGEPYYYRLRQVDLDGTTHFSDIVSVEIEAPSASELLAVFPNPANEQLSVRFFTDYSGQAEFQLYDLSGRMVLSQSMEAEFEGVTEEQISLEQVGTGLYIYQFTAAGRRFTGKIDVLH